MYIYDINSEGLKFIASELEAKHINGKEISQYEDVLSLYASEAIKNIEDGNAPDCEILYCHTKSGHTELIRLDLDTHFSKEKIEFEEE